MSCNCNNNHICSNTCNQPCTCQTNQCACPVLISSDCVNNVTEDLTCSNILKGQTLTEVLLQLDAFICTKFESLANFLTIINVGAGAGVFKGANLLGKKQLRSLVDSNLINIVEGTDEIIISVDEVALNTFIEANQKSYTVSNLDTFAGVSIYKDSTIVGDNTQFNLKTIGSSDLSVNINGVGNTIDLTVNPYPNYKIYTAVLDQVSTGNPSAVVLGTNTIGNIVWTRSTTGIYLGTLVGAFIAAKSFSIIAKPAGSGDANKVRGIRNSNDVFQISTHDNTNTLIDSALNGVLVEIRVYN